MLGFKWGEFSMVALLACLFFVSGCKEPMPTPESVDKTFIGRWELDKAATKDAQIKVLEEAGLLDSKQQREQFDMLYESSYFDFELLFQFGLQVFDGKLAGQRRIHRTLEERW